SASREDLIAWTDDGKKANDHKEQKTSGVLAVATLSPYEGDPNKVVVAANRSAAGAERATFGVWNIADGAWTSGGESDGPVAAAACVPPAPGAASKELRIVAGGPRQTLEIHAVDGKRPV